MKMKPVQAFIFDLDGVITDTAEFHYLSWKQLADEEGLDFTREDNEQLRGVSRRESLLRLLKGKSVDEATLLAWMHRKNEYYKSYLDRLTPEAILPGVVDFLIEARISGFKLGIGSASKNARAVIEHLRLSDMFEVIGDGYSVVNSKPAPDLFVWVAGGLRVPVDQTLVFEDAEAGIDAAKAAGCFTVGVGSANVSHADVVVPDLSQLSLQDLLNRLTVAHSTHEQ